MDGATTLGGTLSVAGVISDPDSDVTVNDALSVTGIVNLGATGQVEGGACTTPGQVTFDGANDELLLCSSIAGNKWVTFGTSGGGGAGGAPGNDSEVLFNNNDAMGTDANFVYTATGRLGVGTAAPNSRLEIASDIEDGIAITQANNQTSTNPFMDVKRSRGTVAAPTIVANNDELFELIVSGYDGNSYSSAAILAFNVDGTPGDGDMPTRLDINLQADGAGAWLGDIASMPELTIRSNGSVGIGDATPDSGTGGQLKLDVEGPVGGTKYCDEAGNNCFTAAGAAGGVGSIDGLSDAYTDYATSHNIIMGRAGAAALTAGSEYNLFIGDNAGATTANSTAATRANTAWREVKSWRSAPLIGE